MKPLILIIIFFLVAVPQPDSKPGKVNGRVTVAPGNMPQAGVIIQIKGTDSGTLTLADGTYSIEISPASRALVFIKPGLKTKKVRIRGRSRMDVVLKKARYRKVVQPDEDLPPDPN
jgi:hypothetical protein